MDGRTGDGRKWKNHHLYWTKYSFSCVKMNVRKLSTSRFIKNFLIVFCQIPDIVPPCLALPSPPQPQMLLKSSLGHRRRRRRRREPKSVSIYA